MTASRVMRVAWGRSTRIMRFSRIMPSARPIRSRRCSRERRAKAEAWQLQKRVNRLEKAVHRGARRIGVGRAGVLMAKRVLDSVKQVLRPSPHERPITS